VIDPAPEAKRFSTWHDSHSGATLETYEKDTLRARASRHHPSRPTPGRDTGRDRVHGPSDVKGSRVLNLIPRGGRTSSVARTPSARRVRRLGTRSGTRTSSDELSLPRLEPQSSASSVERRRGAGDARTNPRRRRSTGSRATSCFFRAPPEERWSYPVPAGFGRRLLLYWESPCTTKEAGSSSASACSIRAGTEYAMAMESEVATVPEATRHRSKMADVHYDTGVARISSTWHPGEGR